MSIVQGQTTSFKYQLFQGTQNFTTDTFYMALYNGNANLNLTTTAYSTTNEITGTGYTAGGKALTGVTLNYDATNSVVYVNFDSLTWNPANFTTRCALIYNSSRANTSVAVIDFGADKSCTNTFTVTMPGNTYSTALIRSA
jgi:hypothetical protein